MSEWKSVLVNSVDLRLYGENEETYSTEDVRGVSKERASLGSRARKSLRSNSLVPLLLTLTFFYTTRR